MKFKSAISLITLIFAFGLSSAAIDLKKSKPINYYIEHEGEQKTKPKYTEGAFEKDALLRDDTNESSLKKKKKKKKEKTYKYKKSKKLKKYSFKSIQAKNKMPLTNAEYLEMSKEKKRADLKSTPPKYPKDDKLVNIPEPNLTVIKYNNPPGAKDIDLRQLMTKRIVISQAVLSPDNSKSVYSKIYSYPGTQQVASEIFYINIPPETPIETALKDFHTIEEVRKPVIKAGTELLFENEKRVLSLLDWSEDSKKIAVVEKIGALTQGPWKTELRTYDFETETAYDLTALREAIRYYWKSKRGIDLIDYMWDIFPVGWDNVHKDRIIVYAYAFDKNKKSPKFLGTWSIDYKNERPELMSADETDYDISINGYALKFTRE